VNFSEFEYGVGETADAVSLRKGVKGVKGVKKNVCLILSQLTIGLWVSGEWLVKGR
jgi:hypothetical protein